MVKAPAKRATPVPAVEEAAPPTPLQLAMQAAARAPLAVVPGNWWVDPAFLRLLRNVHSAMLERGPIGSLIRAAGSPTEVRDKAIAAMRALCSDLESRRFVTVVEQTLRAAPASHAALQHDGSAAPLHVMVDPFTAAASGGPPPPPPPDMSLEAWNASQETLPPLRAVAVLIDGVELLVVDPSDAKLEHAPCCDSVYGCLLHASTLLGASRFFKDSADAEAATTRLVEERARCAQVVKEALAAAVAAAQARRVAAGDAAKERLTVLNAERDQDDEWRTVCDEKAALVSKTARLREKLDAIKGLLRPDDADGEWCDTLRTNLRAAEVTLSAPLNALAEEEMRIKGRLAAIETRFAANSAEALQRRRWPRRK